MAQLVKNLPAMWETWVWSLGWEDPLEKVKATHSSIYVYYVMFIPSILFFLKLKNSSFSSIYLLMVAVICNSYWFFICKSYILLSHADSLWPPWTAAYLDSWSLVSPGVCSNSCPLSWWYHPFHPLLPPSPSLNLFQHQGLFQWISSLHQVAKVLEIQLQHQSFQWRFRTDFL